MDAPELAALVLLEHAIEVAWVAVLAQHVDLLDPDAPFTREAQPGAELTRPFFNSAHALTLVLRRYRAAVARAAAVAAGGDGSRDESVGSDDPKL
jgi:hypothetical protein